MKSLTKHEQYLVGLTTSTAKTPAAQRAAIQREGLASLAAADVARVQRERWAARRKANPTTPVFVLAAQPAGGWQNRLPKGVKPGTVTCCPALRRAAYDRIDWGRLRKHASGNATAFTARVRQETNGKSGWDCVVWRYADYGCVLSPDSRKVAYSVSGKQWTVTAQWRGRFMFEGRPARLDFVNPPKYALRLRDCLQLLRRAGFEAYLTRQTDAQIAAGSGECGRRGKLVLIADLGRYGAFHCGCQWSIVADVRSALAKRIETAEQTELAAIIDRGEAAGVNVCLADSLRAGNCRQGTLGFGDRHHLNPARHYTAGELLAIANGNGRFVRAAVIAALRRERREQSAGVCSLVDHRG